MMTFRFSSVSLCHFQLKEILSAKMGDKKKCHDNDIHSMLHAKTIQQHKMLSTFIRWIGLITNSLNMHLCHSFYFRHFNDIFGHTTNNRSNELLALLLSCSLFFIGMCNLSLFLLPFLFLLNSAVWMCSCVCVSLVSFFLCMLITTTVSGVFPSHWCGGCCLLCLMKNMIFRLNEWNSFRLVCFFYFYYSFHIRMNKELWAKYSERTLMHIMYIHSINNPNKQTVWQTHNFIDLCTD